MRSSVARRRAAAGCPGRDDRPRRCLPPLSTPLLCCHRGLPISFDTFLSHICLPPRFQLLALASLLRTRSGCGCGFARGAWWAARRAFDPDYLHRLTPLWTTASSSSLRRGLLHTRYSLDPLSYPTHTDGTPFGVPSRTPPPPKMRVILFLAVWAAVSAPAAMGLGATVTLCYPGLYSINGDYYQIDGLYNSPELCADAWCVGCVCLRGGGGEVVGQSTHACCTMLPPSPQKRKLF